MKCYFLKGREFLKFFGNKKYNVILRYVLVTIVITLLLILVSFNYDDVSRAVSKVVAIFEPIIWAAVIAFILNPMMMSVEKFLSKRVFKKKARPKASRAIGIVCASIVLIAVIASVILSVIPELISSIPGIYDGIANELIPSIQTWVNKVLEDNPSIASIVSNELNDVYKGIQSLVSSIIPQLTNILTELLDFANSVKNFLFGFILAIYFLFSKEVLQAQAKKLVVALFSESTYSKIFAVTSNTNHALLNFIYGKIIDSTIIGLICAVFMLVAKMPYVLIISLIVGITNIIPVFGPFIGAIPSAILVLIADPPKTIWFVIFIIVLQQIDGNIIGPKILGDKIGISSFWTLFAILVFGSMFGIVGMIIGVPIFAVIMDIVSSIVNRKLRRKDMPTDRDYYSIPGTQIGSGGAAVEINGVVKIIENIDEPDEDQFNLFEDGEEA